MIAERSPGFIKRCARLVAEGVRSSVARPLVSGILGLIAAGAIAGALVASASTDALERRIQQTLEGPAARTIVIRSTEGDLDLSSRDVAQLDSLDVVESVFGLGPAVDVYRTDTGRSSSRVAMFRFVGLLSDAVDLEGGRWPLEGEALVGTEALSTLGFEYPNGVLAQDPLPLRLRDAPWLDAQFVGAFSAIAPNDYLNRAVLMAPEDTGEATFVRQIVVRARSFDHVPEFASALPALLGREPGVILIESSQEFESAASYISSEVAGFSRRTAVAVVGASAIATALVSLLAVHQRRIEFGRKRVLGASRWDLLVVVGAQFMAPTAVGIAAGAALGTAAVELFEGVRVSMEYAAAIALIALMSAMLSTVPPAITAALVDPVRALRVP